MTDIRVPRRTERLLLRPLVETDADDLLAYRGRDDVCRYLTIDPADADTIVTFVRERLTATKLTGDGDRVLLAVQLGEHVIGDLSLATGATEHRQGEIGWVFNPEFAGHGYATEAARELVAAAFEELGMHRVWAQVDPRNLPSAQLCLRLGMRHEAHLREESWFKGGWGDLAIYAVLREEWLGRA